MGLASCLSRLRSTGKKPFYAPRAPWLLVDFDAFRSAPMVHRVVWPRPPMAYCPKGEVCLLRRPARSWSFGQQRGALRFDGLEALEADPTVRYSIWAFSISSSESDAAARLSPASLLLHDSTFGLPVLNAQQYSPTEAAQPITPTMRDTYSE